MARRLHRQRSGSEEGRRFLSINTMVRLNLRGKSAEETHSGGPPIVVDPARYPAIPGVVTPCTTKP